MCKETSLTQKLLDQPGIILQQEHILIELSQKHLEGRKLSEDIKSAARSEAAMNLSFKNEAQRTASVESVLHDNQQYQELQKHLLEQDKQIRIETVKLAFEKDMLKVYIAIAGINSVKT